MAGLYNKTGGQEKAISTYPDYLSLNTSHIKANYTLGVLYYNNAAKLKGIVKTPADKNPLKENLTNAEFYLKKANDLHLENVEIDMLITDILKMK